MSSRANPETVDPLWEAYWTGGKTQAVRDEIVENYFWLVRRVTLRVVRRLPVRTDRAVVESAAGMGLVEAVERFDPAKDSGFPGYAWLVMRSRIQDALRLVGSDPLRRARRDVERLYVEEPPAQEPDEAPLQSIAGGPAPGAAVASPLVAMLGEDDYRALELRARAILHLRFFGDFRQREIAQLLGITEARVSQILRKVKICLSRSVSLRTYQVEADRRRNSRRIRSE